MRFMDLRPTVRYLLHKSEMSLRELAKVSGVRRQSIAHFLNGGNIHLTNLDKLLEALGYRLRLSTTPEELKPRLARRISLDSKKISKFCKKYHIRSISLFGSVLRGDFQQKSDIDVLVDFEKAPTFFELDEIEEELKKLFKTNHKLDLVTLHSLSPIFANDILNSSETLYEQVA